MEIILLLVVLAFGLVPWLFVAFFAFRLYRLLGLVERLVIDELWRRQPNGECDEM